MNLKLCPACGNPDLLTRQGAETAEHRGIHVHVSTMLSSECAACGYVFTTQEQHDANVAAIKAAYVAQSASVKAARGLLTGAQIRAIREFLTLTQKEAAELFGGGPVAFSKYENEDVSQSAAMDKLIRLVAHMGQFGVRLLRGVAAEQPAPAVLDLKEKPQAFVVSFHLQPPHRTAGTQVQRTEPSAKNVAMDVQPRRPFH